MSSFPPIGNSSSSSSSSSSGGGGGSPRSPFALPLDDAKGETSRIINDDREYVEIYPEHLSFGCVAQGFVYSFTVTVVNKAPKPQALKVQVTPAEGETNKMKSKFIPMKIASGVKQHFQIQLVAANSGTSNFNITITQGINKVSVTRPIKALVVPLEVFKHVSKSLMLQKRPIYRNGVSVLGAIASMDDSRSVVTGGATVLTEAMMDEADLEEILSLPIVSGVYFDSVTKQLKVDSKLCEVVVQGNWQVQDSVSQTNALREDRMKELEEKGCHTSRFLISSPHAAFGHQSGGGTGGGGGSKEGEGGDELDGFNSSVLSNPFGKEEEETE